MSTSPERSLPVAFLHALRSVITGVRRLFVYFLGQSWVRFGIVGVAATLTYAALGLIFAEMGLAVLLGNALAYVISFGVSYVGHHTWSFQSRTSHRSALPRFAATQAAGLGLNTIIIAVLMHWGVPYVLAMLVAIVAVPVAVFLASKFWVFKSPSDHIPTYPPEPPRPGSHEE